MVVRTDPTLGNEVQANARWDEFKFGGLDDPIDQSFSGEERNKWYYNVAGQSGRIFSDLSTLSGMDSVSDGRVFTLWDFNRDGRTDVVLTNANAPLLNLYENQIQTDHQFVAFKFVGGMTNAKAQQKFSTRDGYGAIVTLKVSDNLTIKREFRCGEGFAGQNSDVLLVGIGLNDTVQEVSIKWPSGITDTIANVPAKSLTTLIEHSNDGKPTHETEAYLR